jgi:UDP-N-acetylmuramate--alanine ligase
VVQEAQPGDLILTLGAGNVSQLGPQIVERLKAREKAVALSG